MLSSEPDAIPRQADAPAPMPQHAYQAAVARLGRRARVRGEALEPVIVDGALERAR